MNAATELEQGSKFKGYRVGFAINNNQVNKKYQVRDPEGKIKVLELYSLEPSRLEEVLGLAESVSDLEDFPTLYEASADEGYAVREFISGMNLKSFFAQEAGVREDFLAVQAHNSLVQMANRYLPIFLAMAKRVQAVHANGYLHLDIKPAQFIHGKKGTALLDFDLARRAQQIDGSLKVNFARRTFVGTAEFAAQEFLEYPIEISQGADVASLGISFYTLAAGLPPYFTPKAEFGFIRGRYDEYPNRVLDCGYSEEFRDLIVATQVRHPDNRIHIDEIVVQLQRMVEESKACKK
jgi:serine/threonine protein kinase